MDEAMRPVAVSIDCEDGQEIEQPLESARDRKQEKYNLS